MRQTYRKEARGRRAFTLVEFAIVMALIVLFALLAAPGIIRNMPVYRLNAAEENLLIHLRAARLTAMSEQKVVVFQAEAPSAGTYCVWVDRNGDGAMQDTEKRPYHLPGGNRTPFVLSNTVGIFRPNGSFTAASVASPAMYTNTASQALNVIVSSNGYAGRSQLTVYGSGMVTAGRL